MAKKKNKKVKEIEKEFEEIEETDEVEEIDVDEDFEEIEVDEDEDLEEKKSLKKKIKKIIDDEDEDSDEEYEEITMEERLVLIEKKITFILVFLVIIAIMTFVTLVCSLRGDSTTPTTNTGDDTYIPETTTYDTSAFKEIKGTDIATESKNETIVVMIGRQSCGFCAQFAPVLEQVSKSYGITARYIDLAKILDFTTGSQTVSISDNDSYNAIVNLSGSGDYKTFAKDNFGYTPVTMIIKNNKVIAGTSGNMTAENLEALFKTGGLSK